MPWASGLDVLRCTRELANVPPFVLITAFADEGTRLEASEHGAAMLLSKPFEMEHFMEVVRTLVPPRHSCPA